MAFTRKILTFSFSGAASIEITNVRASVHTEQAGENAMIELNAKIWGLTLAHMNALSTLGRKGRKVHQDQVTVQAGDSGGSMSTVFIGTIDSALSDFQGAADVPLHIMGWSGLRESAQKLEPTSKKGSADVKQVMQELAGKMGLGFEGGQVSTKISNPYLWGSARNQAMMLAEAAGINWQIEKGKLVIWPKDGSRSGGGTVVSAQTGMVGYPSSSSQGIKVRMLYNPSIQCGSTITVQSIITPANGQWIVKVLTQDLESFKPNGQWFTTAECAAPADEGGGASATPTP